MFRFYAIRRVCKKKCVMQTIHFLNRPVKLVYAEQVIPHRTRNPYQDPANWVSKMWNYDSSLGFLWLPLISSLIYRENFWTLLVYFFVFLKRNHSLGHAVFFTHVSFLTLIIVLHVTHFFHKFSSTKFNLYNWFVLLRNS